MKQYIIYFFGYLILFYGCINNGEKKGNEKISALSVTDFRGKTLTFDQPPNRIVCLIESTLSGLYMLHAENKVLGISSNVYDGSVFEYYAKLDPRIKNKNLPTPGNWDFVSIENIIALEPDLVIIWSSQSEAIDVIESKGIPVYGVMLKSVADVYKEMSDLGIIIGNKMGADTLIQFTRDELKMDSFRGNKQLSMKPKVYFMWSQGPLETSGTGSTVNELIEMAGAVNSCTSSDEHLVVNLENVIEWDPDVIVMWCNDNKDTGDIINLSGWQNIKAIKEKRVFELPSVFMCDLWTLKFQYAVKLLNRWCYPAISSDEDSEKFRIKMLNKLYGREDLN